MVLNRQNQDQNRKFWCMKSKYSFKDSIIIQKFGNVGIFLYLCSRNWRFNGFSYLIRRVISNRFSLRSHWRQARRSEAFQNSPGQVTNLSAIGALFSYKAWIFAFLTECGSIKIPSQHVRGSDGHEHQLEHFQQLVTGTTTPQSYIQLISRPNL